MLKVLNDVIKIMNNIKSRPLKTRIFETICKEMGSDHVHLLLHTKVRWLSRGQVFNRVIELKEELELFFEQENLPIFKEFFRDENWWDTLADIFKKLNDLNASMQGSQETIISSTNKIRGFKNKIIFWKSSIIKGDFSNFLTFSKLTMGKSNIIEHLVLLEEKIKHYFPSLTTSTDWVVLPFHFIDNVNELDLTNDEKNEFIDICSSSTIRILYNSQKNNIDSFWLSTASDYPAISQKAILLLSYLCEQAFSALNNVKTSSRNRF